MTTGAEAARRALSAGLAWAAWLCPVAAFAAEPQLEAVMRGLAQVKASSARFVERKDVAILSAPLESSGILRYTAPDRLEKRTLKPREEALLLEGDRLTFESGGQRRAFVLREQPLIGAFVEAIRSTLAGDLATLRRHYRVSLEGAQPRWRLTLVPLEPAMLNVLTEITISGAGARLQSVDILEANGDRSVMIIRDEEAKAKAGVTDRNGHRRRAVSPGPAG